MSSVPEAFARCLAELAVDPWCVIARRGNDYAGYSVMRLTPDSLTIDQSWTGVRPALRRRAIATAHKALARHMAAAKGYAKIRTVLRADNAAALALNRKFGYQDED